MSENNPLTQGSRVWVFNVPSKKPSPSHASDPDVAPLSQSEVAAEIPSGPSVQPLYTISAGAGFYHNVHIHDPNELPATHPAVDLRVTPPDKPLYTVPAGTYLPDTHNEVVKHDFLIFETELLDLVIDQINLMGWAIPNLIRSKLATVCSDVDRYYWRAYAFKLDSSVISITAYGTPKYTPKPDREEEKND